MKKRRRQIREKEGKRIGKKRKGREERRRSKDNGKGRK